MQTFKKGQRVWWNDPIHEKSGEYDVLDPQDKLNAGKPEHECSILIGNGEDTWDSPAEYLTIVFPISFVDREQLAMQEHRNSIRDKELVEHMQELVAQFENQALRPKGIRFVSATKTTTPAAFTDFLCAMALFTPGWITATTDNGRCRLPIYVS